MTKTFLQKKFLLTILLPIILLLSSNITARAINVQYINLDVPHDIFTYRKTWEDRRCISNRYSDNYKWIERWGWIDGEGFWRANGERDLGITDDYYMIALGSYYGTSIGTKYRITTDTGRVFYGVLCDQKDDRHTNSTHQYALNNNDIVEFIVNTPTLNSYVKSLGSANCYMPLNGNIAKIERIEFNVNY